MADVLMTVRPLTKAGVADLSVDAYHTNPPAGCELLIPNDGRTILIVDGVAGDTFTFVPKNDKYGRSESLTLVVGVGTWGAAGPFLPDLWNDSAGCLHCIPTVGKPADILLAIRVANPT